MVLWMLHIERVIFSLQSSVKSIRYKQSNCKFIEWISYTFQCIINIDSSGQSEYRSTRRLAAVMIHGNKDIALDEILRWCSYMRQHEKYRNHFSGREISRIRRKKLSRYMCSHINARLEKKNKINGPNSPRLTHTVDSHRWVSHILLLFVITNTQLTQ